jgi:hypothetical protein
MHPFSQAGAQYSQSPIIAKAGAVIVPTVDPVGHGKRFNSERTRPAHNSSAYRARTGDSLRSPRQWDSLIVAAFLTGKVAIGCAYSGMSESGHRSWKCGAVYDRSEHIEEAREISSFECAVCGKTIENWNSAWVPRYRFIACPAKMPKDRPPFAVPS